MSKTLLAVLAASTSILACTDAKQPDVLALPGQAYYPESLSASDTGTLYVGSLATGQVVAFDDGSATPREIIPAGSRGVTGVLAHGADLWTCSVDTSFQSPTEVHRYGLDGALKESHALAPDQFCNDLAFDGAGVLYVTDSFSGNVLRLAGELEPFVHDARFVPATQGAFGLDGIVFDGAGSLIINKLDTGGLYRIALDTRAITPITVTPPLAGPDGMRLVDAHTLLVVEGAAGRLSRVELHGDTATATALAGDLDMPTGVAIARGSAWVSEGQLGRLFAMPPQAPELPFAVRRVGL